jgi:hypothetical protein
MTKDLSQINLLTRREIEIRIAGPLIRAFMEELGRDKALPIARKAIGSLARENGALLAERMGGNSPAHLARSLKAWTAEGALEFEIVELSETSFYFNVVRCRYAEMYERLGMPDEALILFCGRDFDLVKGFNPRMTLTRTQTILEGKGYCDFRITLGPPGSPRTPSPQ